MADQGQLDIELQINKAIQARQALLNTQKSMLADQIAFAQELCRAMECKELDGYNERIEETRAGLLKASDATDKTSESNQNLTKQLKKSGKGMTAFKAVAVGAAVAIKNAFGMTVGIVKSLGGLVKNTLVGAFKMVKFAMTGWSKMLGNIAQKGMEAGNAGIGLRNAYEDVREQFGGLETNEGAAVIGMFDNMKARAGNLAGSGLSLSRVFGRGPDGLAAALGYVMEKVSELGPGLDRFAGDMAAAQDQVILLGRGLGFAGEDFRNMALIAGHTGESVNDAMSRMGREIITVAKNLGVNRKVLADNMKTLMKMPEVYGSNTKEMLKTSVAAQKLGVSIEQLHGPMAIFDDFESAATNAADLAAEFGIMVDATEMMTAEPAEQMMMLKDAANAAGKSFDSMSRQERRRLAELTGVDADALFATLDPSNAFDKKALDAAGNQVDAATAATMAQKDATNELSKAMRRLHESMEPMNTQGGFFGAFTHGLTTGLMRSKEGKAIIRSVTEAFRIVYKAGKEVGAELARLFNPGGPLHFLYEYFTNLPQRMNEMMPQVVDAFRTFVDELMVGGETASGALNRLVQKLADVLFGGDGGAVMTALANGFHALADLVVSNIINLVPYILEGFITAFQYAIDLMLGDAPSLGASLGDKAIMPMTQNAFKALMDDGVVQEFGSKFMEMLTVFWDQYGAQITEFISKALSAVLIAAIGQSLIPILASGALISLVKGIFSGLGGALGMASGGGAAEAVTGKTGGIANMAENLHLAILELKEIDMKDLGKAALVLGAIGASIGLGILGLGALAVKLENMGVNDVTMAIVAVAFYAVSQAMVPMAALLKALKSTKVGPKEVLTAAGMMTVVAVLFGAVMYFITGAIEKLSKITFNEGIVSLVEAAGDLAMTGLTVTAAIVGMGAVLAVIAILASNPITGVIIAGAIAAAALIFYAAMDLVEGSISALSEIPVSKALAAKLAAEAAGTVVDTTIKVIDTIFNIMSNIVWDQEMFDAILEDMEEIVESITTKMMPMIQNAANLITEDPQVIKDKLGMVTSLIESFSPIMGLMTAAMSIKDLKPEQIPSLISKISTGIEGVIYSIQSMVQGIVFSTTNLSESQIKSAEVAGPLLQAAAALIGAIMPAQGLFEDQLRQGVEHYIDYEGLNSNEVANIQIVSKTSGEKQEEFIQTFTNLLTKMKDPLNQLIQSLANITIPGDPKEVKEKMEAVGAIMNAVASAGNSIQSMMGTDGNKNDQRGFTSRSADTVRNSIENIADLFYGGDSILDTMVPVINSMIEFGGRFGTDVEEKLKLGQTAFDGLKRFVASMQGLTTSAMKTFTTNMIAVADNALRLEGKFTQGTMLPIKAMLDSMSVLNGYFSTAEGEQAGLYSALPSSLTAFATGMNVAMVNVSTMAEGFREDAVQPLLDMITAYEELNEAASGTLGDININKLLTAFGEALAIKDANITVEREAIQVKINLNVIMKTEDVAEQLIEGDYVLGTDKGLKLAQD